MIAEVLSPGTSARDWKDKFDLYEEAGVGEYWIVAPGEQSISAFVCDVATGRYQLAGEYAGPGSTLLLAVKQRVREAQYRALQQVNQPQIQLY